MKCKLNAADIKAIKASIAHWNRHARGKARRFEGIGVRDCALCMHYAFCPSCPASRGDGCCGRRHAAAAMYFIFGSQCQSEKFRAKARLVRDFLKSLLPKGTK